jgi:hypothetical protein
MKPNTPTTVVAKAPKGTKGTADGGTNLQLIVHDTGFKSAFCCCRSVGVQTVVLYVLQTGSACYASRLVAI